MRGWQKQLLMASHKKQKKKKIRNNSRHSSPQIMTANPEE